MNRSKEVVEIQQKIWVKNQQFVPESGENQSLKFIFEDGTSIVISRQQIPELLVFMCEEAGLSQDDTLQTINNAIENIIEKD